MPDDERYSLTELADLAGVTPRTVRYYLAQGLLPAVGQSGPGSKYDDGHLARLRLIRRLQADHLPLAEIRRSLEGLDDAAVRALSGTSEPPPPPDSALEYLRTVLAASPAAQPSGRPVLHGIVPPPAPVTASARAFAPAIASRSLDARPAPDASGAHAPTDPTARPGDRSQWERIVLGPDIELHIRRPLLRAQNKQVDRLVTIARELLEEDRP